MSRSHSVSLKAKVALAMAFAGGLSCNVDQCYASEKNGHTWQTIDFASDYMSLSLAQKQASIDAVCKAYRLLRQAEGHLKSHIVSRPLEQLLNLPPDYEWGPYVRRQAILGEWIEQLEKGNDYSIKDSALAISTINDAVKELASVTDQNDKQMLILGVSLLLSAAGDEQGSKKFETELDEFVEHCDTNKIADENQIQAAVSILNCRAYAIVDLNIPDQWHSDETFAPLHLESSSREYSTDEIRRSESLWLQCLALVDRLPTTSHTRRMVHRNLCFWYLLLGDANKSQRQKEILFELTGQGDEERKRQEWVGCGMG